MARPHDLPTPSRSAPAHVVDFTDVVNALVSPIPPAPAVTSTAPPVVTSTAPPAVTSTAPPAVTSTAPPAVTSTAPPAVTSTAPPVVHLRAVDPADQDLPPHHDTVVDDTAVHELVLMEDFAGELRRWLASPDR